jgi:hypothetical protein
MVWQAFFDESGERSHSPVLVLGGFLAPYLQWVEFSKQWDLMLGMKPRIEYFEMNEAHAFTGQFVGWSDEERDERVRLAYRIIEDHVSFQATCVVDIEALHRVIPREELLGRQPNPYYVAFSGLITGITQHQRKHLGIDEKIDFIFDERSEKSKIIDAWEDFKVNASDDTRDLLGWTPAFRDDKDVLPLQAADLLAWWVRKMATEEADKIPRVKFPWQPQRQIPGVQMIWDEARLIGARDAIISARHVDASEGDLSSGQSS